MNPVYMALIAMGIGVMGGLFWAAGLVLLADRGVSTAALVEATVVCWVIAPPTIALGVAVS